MRLFDANCRIGRFNYWTGREPITADEVLRDMDHYGVTEALVVASMAHEYHPIDGNAQVMALTEGYPRLHPAWVGLPPHSGELPPGRDLVAEMDERGVRALFLYPSQFRFTLDDWCIDALAGPLAERRVPVFICPNDMVAGPVADQTDWASVVRLCQAFPDLPVVITEARILRTLRTMYAALDACSNLHIDIASMWLHHSYEFISRRWGAHRLLFGTGLPINDPAAVLGQLLFADLPADQIAAIGGGNLHRLLSWTSQPLPQVNVTFPEPIDELHAMARRGGTLAGQGFRCGHGHLGRHTHLHIPDAEPADLIREMDRLGVRSSLVFANAGMNSDEVYGNDLVIAAMRRYPGRFYGLVTANPNRSLEETQREIDRGLAQGMIGVKIHPYLAGYDTNGPKVDEICAYVASKGAIILNHDWGGTERLLDLCRRYPEATFMTGHTSRSAIPVVRQVHNLYIGSCSMLNYRAADQWVQDVGADRILFGTDLSWNPVSWGLGPVLYARMPLQDKRLILGGNLERLMRTHGVAYS